MKSQSDPASWLIYALLRSVFAVMQAFPIEWNLSTARLITRLWLRITSRHHDRAAQHLAEAYPGEFTEAELGVLARRSLESVAMFAVESFCLPRAVNVYNWNQHVRLVDFEPAMEALTGDKGAILVTGHYGPFELNGHLLACLGYNVTAVMRPLDNVYLNRFLVETRRTHGLTLLDKKGAMRDAEDVLKNGGLLAFIGDQDAGRKGMFVDFFGRPASTYKSIGLLAMLTESPIVVGYARRHGHRARYDVGVQRVIHPHEWQQQDNPLRWITQAYTEAIEQFVRVAPEQYLWIHRRWKSQPGTRRRKRISKPLAAEASG